MMRYRLREAALGDVDQALDYYQDVSEALAQAFEQALLDALTHVCAFPGTCSPRYAQRWLQENPPRDLRFWLLSNFPYAVFYFAETEHIEIVRVLHQASDIPQHLKKSSP